MAESGIPTDAAEAAAAGSGGGRGPDEIALEMMKFIAVSTGYGRAGTSSAGFSGKPGTKTMEEQAEALMDLFRKCRKVVRED
jgi:hypothetical protein